MNFRIAILAFCAALTCAVADPIKSFVVKGVVYTNKAEVLKTIGLKKGMSSRMMIFQLSSKSFMMPIISIVWIWILVKVA